MARSYGILISFEPERLALLQRTESEALTEVGVVLAARGFAAAFPGLYIGEVDTVRAVLAAQELADGLTWIAPCLRAARLLRIEEDGDLTVAFK